FRHIDVTHPRDFLCSNWLHETGGKTDGAAGLRARGGALRGGRRGVSGDPRRGFGVDRAAADRGRPSAAATRGRAVAAAAPWALGETLGGAEGEHGRGRACARDVLDR